MQTLNAKASATRNLIATPRRARVCSTRFVQPSFISSAPQVNARSVAAKATAPNGSTTTPKDAKYDAHDLRDRLKLVQSSFPTALSIDDFINRVEIALNCFGFNGDNSISMTNLCRDEITVMLKDKIESVFGSSFNTNGLGGVLTCGVTGMGAGLSHSPVCPSGRERYVFFSFPHIAIDSAGKVGGVSRPGRDDASCACGALIKAMGELKSEGVAKNCKVPGVHDPLDPEYTILKQRLARRLRYEQAEVNSLSLVDVTHVAERTITDDLEYLIEKSVDIKKADYAVVTGVQIHNWAADLEDEDNIPSLEFVSVSKVYVVVNGQKTFLDLTQVPALTPRQVKILGEMSLGAPGEYVAEKGTYTPGSTVQEIPPAYLNGRMGGRSNRPVPASSSYNFSEWPSWQGKFSKAAPLNDYKDPNKPTMDSAEEVHTSFVAPDKAVAAKRA